jgi:hypothetical protein
MTAKELAQHLGYRVEHISGVGSRCFYRTQSIVLDWDQALVTAIRFHCSILQALDVILLHEIGHLYAEEIGMGTGAEYLAYQMADYLAFEFDVSLPKGWNSIVRRARKKYIEEEYVS